MTPSLRFCACPVVLAFLACAASPVRAAGNTDDISVRAEKDGATIRVRVDCPVMAPQAVVWDVLTDYDRMPSFIGNLEQSVVRMRLGNRLQVYQKGRAERGPLSIKFENVREVELVPRSEIRSRVISGDNMPASFTTRIEERDGRLHIRNDGVYTPSMWVPPVIGTSLIEAETRKQFGEIRDEILRRARR
jgi:hypothetical protein